MDPSTTFQDAEALSRLGRLYAELSTVPVAANDHRHACAGFKAQRKLRQPHWARAVPSREAAQRA